MATGAWQIPAGNIRSDTTNTITITDSADTNVGKWVAQYPNATSQGHFCVYFPANYLSGNVTMTAYMRSRSGSSSQAKQFTITYAWQTGSANLAVSTTALTHQDFTFVATDQIGTVAHTVSTGVAASRLFAVRYESNNTGTLGTAELLWIDFEYTIDPSIKKGYRWIPANRFDIPVASGATLIGTATDFTTIRPWSLAFRDANSDYVDCRFLLPSSYQSGLAVTLCTAVPSDGGSHAVVWREDMASNAAGAASDPSLTTGSSFTLSTNSINTVFNFDTDRAAPITPTAGDEVQLRITRLGSDGSDTYTGTAHLYGAMVSWNATDRNPAMISLNPLSGSQSALVLDTDSNTTKTVQSFVASADNHADYSGNLPTIYASGGTVRVRWRSSNSDTSHTVRFRIDTASPASGAGSDPSLTTGSNTDKLSGGANVDNEFTVDVSSGLVASDIVFIRINRIGTGDSFPGTVEILSATLEFNIS
jgi:hypothetical protein